MYKRRIVKDRLFTLAVAVLGFLALAPLFHIVYTVTVRGVPAILEAGPSFFTEPPAPPGSERLGGIAPALLGSFWLALISTMLGIPLAFLVGLFLYEFKESRLARLVRVFTMSLLEIPTILVGMLVYTIVVIPLGGFSVAAGAIALAIVMLPYVATYVERALDSVPATYREAALGLGLSRARTALIIAGIARRGVLAGFLIGFAKAIGETAPLLFTVGSARNSLNPSPFGPGDAVPLLVFQFIATPYENWIKLAWGAAFVLTVTVLTVFIALRVVVREVKL